MKLTSMQSIHIDFHADDNNGNVVVFQIIKQLKYIIAWFLYKNKIENRRKCLAQNN